MKSNKGDEAMWQDSRKGDLLKRSLNKYQYQYPTPASVSRRLYDLQQDYLCDSMATLLQRYLKFGPVSSRQIHP